MSNNGLIYAYVLSGPDKGKTLDWNNIDQQQSHNGEPVWLHFDYTEPQAVDWITNHSGLDPIAIETLLCDETRPRATTLNDGLLIALRGVNLAPGSDPEDMVAIRLWVDQHRIISTRRRRLLSAQDMVNEIESDNGPETTGEFVAMLTDRLINRMKSTIDDTEDKVAQIEDQIIGVGAYALRSEIASLRRQAIALRRYLAPQRDAMQQLQQEKIHLFSEDDRIRLRETTDHLIRYIEDLDSVRDRASITQEEIVNYLSEQMNNRMYVLSIVAAIFLPLGFLTGLLGINVGGMPGAENPDAFWLVSATMTILVGLQVWLFKVKRWF